MSQTDNRSEQEPLAPQERRPGMNRSRLRSHVTLVLAILILIPSFFGFGSKFVEFFAIYSGEADGAFAVAPILNYLLASLGFFMLLLWAAANGMFHNIEKPKITMLEIEQRLDRERELRRTGVME